MIIVKLQGGLGNQMFQYATAKSVASHSKVYLDTSFLEQKTQSNESFTNRKLALSIFENINLNKASKLLTWLLKNKYPLKNIISQRIVSVYQSELNEWIDFKSLKFSHLYMDGYFQNENYFSEIRDQLLTDFSFQQVSEANTAVEKKISSDTNAVSIHIRRGDYLKPAINAFHGLLPISYYQSAIKMIEETNNNVHYYIFSDEPDWCRQNFKFLKNFTIVSNEHIKDWEDMYLMSICKHNIIANSSYSWWAAWLNNNPDKKIIAPKNWFAKTPIDIVPKEWTKI
ncbi:hypothetical protein ABIB40_003605 [Pedobacter sp. UYP30]|uniref:alpha-1,2-fucosyltransferase n=1 Tax=Pedobacter sp. UYP30 TaxID=1756400 RepID=UPI003396A1C2